MKGLGIVAFFLLLTGCAKSPSLSDPVAVDATRVKSILLAKSPSEASNCAQELKVLGASVLYQNSLGVLMTDASSKELADANCAAESFPNEKETAPLRNTSFRNTELPLPNLLKLLPAEEIGARSFIKQNPNYDGRNVVVAVLDTGIELAHPMLQRTPDGKPKIIGFEDFSGEGKVGITPIDVSEYEIFEGPDGKEYGIEGIKGDTFGFGIFKGSTLNEKELKDKFSDLGVLVYQKNGDWLGRVDTDGDNDFSNEKELSDFSQNRNFIRFGEKKSLSAVLNIQEEGKSATLCFDDGSHGTHVAGIAAGFDPKGLSGVAPGAQVLAVKIGDNRLAGGSTTTASKMLAIDYAVAKGADVINISYGIRAGSNLGQSAIDRYVDKVAFEKDVLFSISAGNEGPGIQTIGTPAGANLAITPAAYVSKETAKDSYGYASVKKDNVWYFSSVGPRSDGGWKPSIAAPGSAVSSLPGWSGGFENYRGTSMAAPQVSGGLALVLSAAKDLGLPTSRTHVTRAVYSGAVPIGSLSWIQQGHGLMNVPRTLRKLNQLKATPAIDYELRVNSPTSPTGMGAGIFVRSSTRPMRDFTVGVVPKSASNLPPNFLKTFRIETTAKWIQAPESFWVNNSTRRNFQVAIDYSELTQPGIYSEKITAIDEASGLVAFDVPVTIVQPYRLDFSNGHTLKKEFSVEVGDTKRVFLDLPAGTTALQLDLETNGPRVWAQLLDPEGRLVADVIEGAEPQPALFLQANVQRTGVYELDLSAPSSNSQTAVASVKVRLYSLDIEASPPTGEAQFSLLVQNNFAPTVVKTRTALTHVRSKQRLDIKGDSIEIPLEWAKEDLTRYSRLDLHFSTAKSVYDLMTDYPYTVFCEDGEVHDAGGLELNSTVSFDDLCVGKVRFRLQGAFAKKAPPHWYVDLTESRVLSAPVTLAMGLNTVIESGQQREFAISTQSVSDELEQTPGGCLTTSFESGDNKLIQTHISCP